MARVFRGKIAIPGDQMEAYFQALAGPLHENQCAPVKLTVIPSLPHDSCWSWREILAQTACNEHGDTTGRSAEHLLRYARSIAMREESRP
jgi:hypothetical protein